MAADSITLELARELVERGDHAGAERAYRRLLADDPLNVDLLSRHAAAQIGLGAYGEAAGELGKAVEIAPNSASAHANLAICCFMLGAMRRAEACIARAFELDPGRADIRDKWLGLKSQPYFLTLGCQGMHAPERQVFMSAVVDLLRDSARHLDILEIGSYTGSSLHTWANAMERLHGGTATIVCLDAWGLGGSGQHYDPVMAEALASSHAYEIFLHNASLVPARVTARTIRSLSADALPHLPGVSFDVVYVDGCHHYREALLDITEGRRLVKDGGVLCGDDLELQPDECDLDNARREAGADYVRDPRSGREFHPGVTLAIHEAFGRVSAFGGFWAMRRRGAEFVPISFASVRGVMPSHWPNSFHERIRTCFRGSSELGQLVE